MKPLKWADNLDHDKLGYCVVCSTYLLKKMLVNDHLETVTHNNYDTVTYELDDKSEMRVVICKLCKPDITEADNDKIMKKVVKGWEKEIDNRPEQWPKERKKAYMDRYSKLKIQHRKEK